jgi:hypothetical protein
MVDGSAAFEEDSGDINLVGRVLTGIAVAELELPHIVFTRSRDGSHATYSGPYESGILALAAADAEWRADRDRGGEEDLTFHVAALYPAIDPRDLDAPTSQGRP